MSSRRSSLIRLSVITALAVAVLACQTTRSRIIQQRINLPKTVFPLAELNKNPSSRDAVFQEIMRGQTAIIKIDKDYVFPLIFDLKNKAAEIDLGNDTIELSFKRDMFLSISKKSTMLSKDGRNWYNIKNLEALKQLLAYNKGTLTFSVSANSADSVAILMTIRTD